MLFKGFHMIFSLFAMRGIFFLCILYKEDTGGGGV